VRRLAGIRKMKWQFPRNCAKQVTMGLHLSTFAARDFAFAGDHRERTKDLSLREAAVE
jgi:hypothetical protein